MLGPQLLCIPSHHKNYKDFEFLANESHMEKGQEGVLSGESQALWFLRGKDGENGREDRKGSQEGQLGGLGIFQVGFRSLFLMLIFVCLRACLPCFLFPILTSMWQGPGQG